MGTRFIIRISKKMDYIIMNENIFNSGFFITVAGIIAGLISGILVYLNKSKCKTFSCFWGCFQCNRDIENEVKLEKFKIEHHVPTTPTNGFQV
jgi:hypothetical protein